MRDKKGITLIALIVTIIVLLILAGVSIATITGENGLLERARIAKEANENVINEENTKISQYENEIDNYSAIGRAGESNSNLYQRLRSDVSIDVSFSNGGSFTAPTDGYYILITNVLGKTEVYQAYLTHHLENGTLIEAFNPSGYYWNNNSGCTIYMKKGEYLRFTKETGCSIASSKFWYAEGCVPNE